VEEGLYCCHVPACGAQGDVFSLVMRARSLNFTEAVAELAARVGLTVEPFEPRVSYTVTREQQEQVLAAYIANGGAPPPPPPAAAPEEPTPIDEAVAAEYHARLLERRDVLAELGRRRGLTQATVERFQLGHDGARYFIPIRDAEGRLMNIRRYALDASGPNKMISWRAGYGTARLFPMGNLLAVEPGDTVFLMEGEMDCLLANQCGLRAVTTTGGAGTWREVWNEQFRDLHVVICYDVDEAGRAGARHVAEQLVGLARSVKVVALTGMEAIPGGDFTDYIHNLSHAATDFLTLVSNTPVFVAPQEPSPPVLEEVPEVVPLSKASEARFFNKKIVTDAVPSGKTTSPYLVPHKVRLSCGLPGLKMCGKCKVDKAGGTLEREFRLAEDEAGLLSEFVDTTDSALTKLMKERSGVPTKCTLVHLERTANANVELVQLIPSIDRTTDDSPYVTRKGIYYGHGLQTNRPFRMSVVTVPDPKTQLATHIIVGAIPAQSSVDAFTLTPAVVEQLRVFQPEGESEAALWRQIDHIYDDMERFLRIYQRRDLMLAADLTFHSVLSFVFQGQPLTRGWVEMLAIGDTRTGKTSIIEGMTKYYGAGEMCYGENTTKAGLVGGLHQIGTTWALQWGKIVLNDRGLVVIDEASALPLDQIGGMSAMRSSGIATITKVHTESTHSRTRAIWISNPRQPAGPLSSFSQGVLAVKQLIGAPEDIARFDMVVSASAQDVSTTVINAMRGAERPERFTAALCHQRVMWAWSRSPAQVQWTEAAERAALEAATTQGAEYRYTNDIPLVEPNEQRIKIARLAVAAAALFFSCDETGQCIVVKPVHVRFVNTFLNQLYRKPSLAFDEYARHATRRNEIHPRHDTAVSEIVERRDNGMEQLMEQETFTQRDLSELLNYPDREDLRVAVAKLRDVGFLRRQGSSYYLKTPAAITWLRARLNGGRGDAVARFSAPPPSPTPTNGVPPGTQNGDLPDEPDF
jgi:hypothetical protein